MITTIRRMLRAAYRYFGITQATEINQLVRRAIEHMDNDREYYIEKVDVEDPDYGNSVKYGVICKLIPIAREQLIDEEGDKSQIHTLTLMLLVTKVDACYVNCYEAAYYNKAEKTQEFAFPVYQDAVLKNMKRDMEVLPPWQLRPIATADQWDNYCHIFHAYMRMLRNIHLNFTPRSTERAVWALDHADPVTIQTSEQSYTGKLVELAYGMRKRQKLEDGSRQFTETRICYMVTEKETLFLTKLCCRTFNGTAEAREEDFYTRIQLEDIMTDMHPMSP